MRVRFRFPYNKLVHSRWEDGKAQHVEMTEDGHKTYAALAAIVPEMPEDWREFHSWNEYTGDLAEVLELCPGIEVLGTVEQPDLTMSEKIEKLTAKLDRYNPETMFNERCNVHVPGFGMLAISELLLEEDACTDRINEYLKEGWRIVAVCPQPDQRRPDYVMGRNRVDE